MVYSPNSLVVPTCDTFGAGGGVEEATRARVRYLGQHSGRASWAPSSFSARVQDLPLRSELPGRHCPGSPPGTLRRSFLKRRPSRPPISKSRGPRCPKSRYNSIWAARFLCVWAGYLEFPTAGGSTNHEQC